MRTLIAGLVIALGCIGCGESSEPLLLSLPVKVAQQELGLVRTNLDYDVSINHFRLALSGMNFRSRARVIGSFRSPLVIDWANDGGNTLGAAIVLPGSYSHVDLHLRTVTDRDNLEATDGLINHVAFIEGSAELDGKSTLFTIRIDLDRNNTVAGIPLRATLNLKRPVPIMIQYVPTTADGRTLFDDLDFEALDDDNNGKADIGSDAPVHRALLEALTDAAYYRSFIP